MITGIGQAALKETLEFVGQRRRNARNGTVAEPRRDPVVQELIGEVSAKLFAAEAALDRITLDYDRVRASVVLERGVERPLDAAALDALSASVFRAQSVVLDSVLALTTQIFEVGGASSVESARGLDRHWRNARTVASHNPLRFRLREIGDHLLNGSSPDYGWGRGTGVEPTTSTNDDVHLVR